MALLTDAGTENAEAEEGRIVKIRRPGHRNDTGLPGYCGRCDRVVPVTILVLTNDADHDERVAELDRYMREAKAPLKVAIDMDTGLQEVFTDDGRCVGRNQIICPRCDDNIPGRHLMGRKQ